MSSQHRTAVIGTGAIGGIIAAYLTQAGSSVTAIDPWLANVETMRDHAMTITGPDEDVAVAVPALHIDELDRVEKAFDLVVVAVKSYDTEWAVRLMQPYLGPQGIIMSAQNGINEERILRYVPARQLVACVVTLAAEMTGPAHVRRTLGREWPAFTLGAFDAVTEARLPDLAALLSPVGEVKVTSNTWGERWSKLTLNSMTNGTGGASGLTTRHLWADSTLVRLAIGIAAETATVAAAAGVDMTPVFGRIEASLLRAAYLGDPDAVAQACAQLTEIGGTRVDERENKPSLLQDVLKGRRTEIEYLNGFIARRGAEVGVETPLNTQMAELVRDVERGRRSPDPAHLAPLLEWCHRN